MIALPTPAKRSHQERISYVTSVTKCLAGEHRASIRATPRLELTYSYGIDDKRLAEFNHLFRKYPHGLFWCPLWSDIAHVGAISSGATSIPVDTTSRRFVVGNHVVITEKCGEVGDTVPITSVSSGSVGVTALARSYEQAAIAPCFKGTVTNGFRVTRSEPDSHTASVSFSIDDYPDYAAQNQPSYANRILLTDVPRLNPLSDSVSQRVIEIDGGLGGVATDPAETYVRRRTSMHWQLWGLQEIKRLRELFGYVAGKYRSFYAPSFNKDIEIISVSGTSVTIQKSLPADYRGHIAFIKNDQSIDARKVISISETPTEQTLTLDSALSGVYLMASLIYLMRFDTDSFSFSYNGNICTVSAPMVEVIDVQ